MNDAPDKFRILRSLIEKALDGTLTEEDTAQLESLISQDPEQRRYYCQYLHMTNGLIRCCSGLIPATGEQQLDSLLFSSLWSALSQEEKTAPSLDSPSWDIPAPASSTEPKTSPSRICLTLGALAAVCLLGLLLFLVIGTLYQDLTPHEVATLEKSLNASFQRDGEASAGSRLTNQKRLWNLESGLAEIRFDSGARVVLEGPASFRLLQENQMWLKSGQLFAMVPPQAHGFSVRTPSSSVVDMGTEFGLKVNIDGTSAVHMIQGKASLSSADRPRKKSIHILTAGQAKRVESNGQVQDIPIEMQGFVRQFNPKTAFVWRGEGFSVADLVGQGNGLGTGRSNVFLDPVEGYQDRLYSNAKGNTYHPCPGNPFIDGLFVPDGSSPQIITSQGHRFEDCPPTNGECYAALSANPDREFALYDPINTLTVRVVDPSSQGTDAFVLTDETYTIRGDEPGTELMPEPKTEKPLGTGIWVHFKLGTPVRLHPNQQYGFDVTVTYGDSGYYFETAGVADDYYPGGSAYSSGTEPGTNSLQLDRVYQGDHTFIVELEKSGPTEPTQSGLTIDYTQRQPNLGPVDVSCLKESTIDRDNVSGFPTQTYSVDNDYATYIAYDRQGLGQTFTTSSDPNGYLMTGFWLKNVKYQQDLPNGNGTHWSVGAHKRNGLVEFDGRQYGSGQYSCIVMHANLGITFDLQALRELCPGITAQRFVCQTGVGDFEEAEACNMDFWVLVDGQVRASLRQVTRKGILNDMSIDLRPTDRFLTLVTTDGGDMDRPDTFQRSYAGDWGVFVEPLIFFK